MYQAYPSVAKSIDADEEIDCLFEQLEVIEPPSFLVDRILTSVARLSRAVAKPEPSKFWMDTDNFGRLIVRNNTGKLS